MCVKFKIGDRIILKKNRTRAKIIDIDIRKKQATILDDDDDFPYIEDLSELILLDDNTDKPEAYGPSFEIKDKEIIKSSPKNKLSKRKNNREKIRIDLHIEKLISHYEHLDNFAIIQHQLDYCQKELDRAIQKNEPSLEIIHGRGGQVLKTEVHKLLKNYNLRFYLSSDTGSTKVLL